MSTEMARETTRGVPPQTAASPKDGWRTRIPAVMAGIVGVIALLSLASMVVPALNPFSEASAPWASVLALVADIQPNLGWVLVLVLVAGALAARKRAAWVLLFGYTLLYLAGDLLDLLDVVDEGRRTALLGVLVVHLLMLTVLLIGYRQFFARVRAGAWPAALATLVGLLLLGVLLGWGLIELFPGASLPQDRLEWSLAQIVGFGLGITNYDASPPAAVMWVLGLFGGLALVGAAAVLLRSRRGQVGLSDHDEAALRVLVERHGADDSLAFFNTRRDKSVVFSEDGRAAIAFRVEAGVCLASGDPIGDRSSWDSAIGAWLRAMAPYGWVPAVIGASRTGATAYDRHDLETLELGDEAILDLDDFSLRGTEMAPVRQAVSRATRAGLQIRIRRQGDVDPAHLAHLGRLVDTWRGDEDERGFSMALGRWGDPGDSANLIVEGYVTDDRGERTVGLLSFVPWGPTGGSLDVMRRAEDAPNGTFEAMVTGLCEEGGEFGLKRVSLNFAMFRSAFERGADIGAGPILRAWRHFLLFLSRWWQLESLYRANLKYRPHWSTRYLCFAGTRELPQIALAVGMAEGFVRTRGPRWNLRGSSAQVTSNAPALATLDEPEVPPTPRPEQVRVRLAKTERLQAGGVDPWPVSDPPANAVSEVRDAADGQAASVSGRVLAVRDFGGVVFAVVRDWSGDVQVVLERDHGGADALLAFRRDVDLGDLVRFSGVRGNSRSGEVSLLADRWRLDAKCLHPMPDKRRGIADPEARVRQRHLDLAVNPALRSRLRARSAVLHSLRSTLTGDGYLEVETPILQTIHGGANARPFQTHINAYDLDLYLRIAPELFLKRLCVGGMGKIFELGRTFRNEGVDFSHNPEFTILEAYEAHGDYLTMMKLCRELIQNAAIAANGDCVVPAPDGTRVDISGDWPVKTLHQAVSEALVARGGSPVDATTDETELRRQCDLAGVPHQSGWDAGQIALEMYEHLVEKQTTRPTFYTDFPLSVSPLTRSHRSTPGVTERWDLVAWGVELGTAYSELTDPLEQRRRLTAQSEEAAGGDPEAMELDEDFLTALEYGMPPTGGLGIGVDRVVMLITGASIRETLPFPMVRPTNP